MDIVQCQGLSLQHIAIIPSRMNHLADILFCFRSLVQVLPVLFVLLVIAAIWHLGGCALQFWHATSVYWFPLGRLGVLRRSRRLDKDVT